MRRRYLTAARPPWWLLALLAITAGGLALRVIYSDQTPPPAPVGDPWFYHQTAKALVDGHGYAGSQTYATAGATAEHPPLYSILVAALTALGAKGEAAQRLIASLIAGAAFIPAVGYLGRRAVNARVGLIAAGLAAVFPTLIAAQASGESEALFGVFVALVLLWTYRLLANPNLREAAVLGTWIALATLTRSDGVLLAAIPLVILARRRRSWPWRTSVATLVVTALVISPWVIRNWAEFGRPTLSTNLGTLVAGTNCRPAYYGPTAGAFRLQCLVPLPSGNELERSDALVDRGVSFAQDHVSRLPYLFAVRFLDVWGVRNRNFEFNVYASTRGFQRLEHHTYYPLVVLAAIGFFALWRRRLLLWPLLVPFVMTSLIAVLSYGTTRFRHASEVVMVVLAAAAVDVFATLLDGRRSRSKLKKSTA